MKKAIAISSLLLGVVFLSGCGPKQDNQIQSNAVVDETVANFTCGSQVKDASGIAYGTVLAEDGNCWLDRNLGATRVATSITDEAAYGWYFQFGRGADGHQIPTSDTTDIRSSGDVPGHAKFITNPPSFHWRSDTINPTSLWQGVNGINNPCPPSFRLPTASEWTSLIFSNAKIENSATAFKSKLKLVAAGSRISSGALTYRGSEGYYWSSSQYVPTAYLLFFHSTFANPALDSNRPLGASVRCLKD